jgi:predicted AlkP superfamily pyrophosphatase or phosphodiesterase
MNPAHGQFDREVLFLFNSRSAQPCLLFAVMLRFLLSVTICLACLLSRKVAAAEIAKDRHVVIVVWDGMRPDFVSAETTPILWKLAQGGVTFRNHHAVYLTATHVNGTAIETGMYPGHSGLIANYDYRPEIEKTKFISTEQTRVINKGDALSSGHYLSVPTLAEMVRAVGGRTVVAAAKTVGLLLDRQPDRDGGKLGETLSAGETRPRDILSSIIRGEGDFPGSPIYSSAQRDSWTTAALTNDLWARDVPAFSILWLGEPDLSQHETAPGSPAALAAIKSSDTNLGRVLAALEEKGVRSNTDVMVVSDHGFSTIAQANDLSKVLKAAGLNAVGDLELEDNENVQPGEILMIGNGGSVLFYVVAHDQAIIRKLIATLQQSDFAGVIFSKDGGRGAFAFSQALIDSSKGPDVVMAFRWTEEKNEFGAKGLINSDWNRKAGRGTHATLSPFDVHNTLVAAGPDFRAGQVDELPTGNVDIAPTVLRVLKIKPAKPMDGRVLEEALNGDSEAPKAVSETLQASQEIAKGKWSQWLRRSRVGETIYLDAGNGSFTAEPR